VALLQSMVLAQNYTVTLCLEPFWLECLLCLRSLPWLQAWTYPCIMQGACSALLSPAAGSSLMASMPLPTCVNGVVDLFAARHAVAVIGGDCWPGYHKVTAGPWRFVVLLSAQLSWHVSTLKYLTASLLAHNSPTYVACAGARLRGAVR
jgi:hypothetical protein